MRRADGATKDIPVENAGGYVKISVQDNFCSGSSCTVSIIYDQTSYHNDLIEIPEGPLAFGRQQEADARRPNLGERAQSARNLCHRLVQDRLPQ